MNFLSIVSTKAEDILINKKHEIISKQPGGPLLFIENAIKELGIPYKTFYGHIIPVEILMTDEGEFGKINHSPEQQIFPVKQTSDWAIVSTVLDEWDVSSIKQYRGKLFIDIQGYVRDGSSFGKKKQWNESTFIAKYIYCLKGTREEISYLPQDVLENQKKKMLVITDGKHGVELWIKGKKEFVLTKTIVDTHNTIGSGDTFFAYFVGYLYQGLEPIDAVRSAMDKTASFLSASKN